MSQIYISFIQIAARYRKSKKDIRDFEQNHFH